MNKKKITITLFVIILVAITAFIVGRIAIKQESNTPTGTNNSIDPQRNRDTNEDLSTSCPDALCTIDGSRLFTTKIFGAKNLSDILLEKISEGPFRGDGPSPLNYDIVSGIAIYSDGLYSSLTIIPESLSLEDSTLKGELRFEQTDKIVGFRVNIITNTSDQTRRGHVVIDDGFHYLGGFTNIDSITRGKQTIRQLSYKESALSVSITDKESALRHIVTLGYKITDLNITFTDYRNPFE